VRTTLVADQGMDFVDDHGLDRGQHAPASFAAQQHEQGFRGGQQDLGRLASLGSAFARCGITGAQAHSRHRLAIRPCLARSSR
jgi:hypothetical protein